MFQTKNRPSARSRSAPAAAALAGEGARARTQLRTQLSPNTHFFNRRRILTLFTSAKRRLALPLRSASDAPRRLRDAGATRGAENIMLLSVEGAMNIKEQCPVWSVSSATGLVSNEAVAGPAVGRGTAASCPTNLFSLVCTRAASVYLLAAPHRPAPAPVHMHLLIQFQNSRVFDSSL
ncbi:hypothetical protein EVAR_53708_1 [Eumeta japonica]|uniref:Uncharacterized protein n=1 Tax=Eumeta variegata TaxID=151549 RepID=A0A4C1Z2Q8_EUMVA|nr:hypothetical protein EVAR_53708_1 [Eumeta japonica]